MKWKETTLYLIEIGGRSEGYEDFYRGHVEGGEWNAVYAVFKEKDARNKALRKLKLEEIPCGPGGSASWKHGPTVKVLENERGQYIPLPNNTENLVALAKSQFKVPKKRCNKIPNS